MRQPQNAKRGRGRGRRGNGNNHHNHVPNRNTSYESNGPDVKLRGNAQQLHEKYMALAHDAASAGERISAEGYTQFADHYFRLHQAAVGVAETKRQQDLAAAAVTANASSGEAASGESASSDATASAISSDNHGAAEPAVGDSDESIAVKHGIVWTCHVCQSSGPSRITHKEKECALRCLEVVGGGTARHARRAVARVRARPRPARAQCGRRASSFIPDRTRPGANL